MKGEQVDEANIRAMFASAVDRMDPDELAGRFTEDGSFRFGNAEPVVGRRAIREAQAAFFSTIDGMRHDVQGIWSGKWEHGEVYSAEAEVTYTRKDGSEVKLPVTSTLRMKGDSVQDWRVFMDVSPLYAEGGAA
jgi:ketosteroid isomerase-like protein